MTTIAADARTGVIVSDSKMSLTSSDVWLVVRKIHRHKADLIGISGDVEAEMKWLDWLSSGRKGRMPSNSGIEALILRKEGLFYLLGPATEFKIERGWHAIGSGGGLALGAMSHGASAEEAVAIACQHDLGSGGDLQIFNLKDA